MRNAIAESQAAGEAHTAFATLTRHFFSQFVHGDKDGDDALASNFAGIIGLLAGPAVIYVFFDMPRYSIFKLYGPAVQIRESLPDKVFLIAIAMVAMGFLAVFKWDALVPERSDYVILLPLPMRYRTVFLAKLAALAAFLGAFLVAVNAVALVFFPAISFRPEIAGLLRTFGANAIALLAGGLFGFLVVAALHGAMMSVLPYASSQRLAPYAQSALLVALLALFFFSLQSAATLLQFKDENNALLYFTPPFWFAGLWDRLLGHADAVQMEMSRIALRCFGIVLAVSALSYALHYRRHVRQVLEWQAEGGDPGGWAARAAQHLSQKLIVRAPRQQAVYWFLLRTVFRSRRHRLLLAIYTAAGVAMVAEGGVAMVAGVTNFRQTFVISLLCLPFMVTCFLVAALRHAFTLPFELPSAWVFRLTRNDDTAAIGAAIRRAAMSISLLPLWTISTAAYVVFFPIDFAVYASLFALIVMWTIVEAALMQCFRVPFGQQRQASHPAVAVLAIVALVLATSFSYAMANLERAAAGRPLFAAVTLAVMAGVLAVTIWTRRRTESGTREEGEASEDGRADSPFLVLDLGA